VLTALPDLSKIAIVCANCAAMVAIRTFCAVTWGGRCFSFFAFGSSVCADWPGAEMLDMWRSRLVVAR
jgi:hypothetical protein